MEGDSSRKIQKEWVRKIVIIYRERNVKGDLPTSRKSDEWVWRTCQIA